ncbi:putative DNA binding domain-containing protein [Hymenobacter sp. BT507]|uniref:DNA binding domain-containing protein n=1 Tax=Hymenobacter citatus TaxID=2763506 RepID=A0ABR7MH90_9BACT|nr:RNA-binding domain-containing protein [Hymenobacter citatus]MBC6610457.1 putative DNA binding domain-containing protein [Hymenobacter citatus]
MTLLELEEFREGVDFEAKVALGRDGKGTLPQTFWETYSAFPNTDGGVIALGVKELTDHSLDVKGVPEPERLQKELWNGLNNRKIISHNLLNNENVSIITVHGHGAVVLVRVPRARRQDRPVYVGTDVLTGTFRRQHEGDYRCPENLVKRMLGEAQHDTLDDRALFGYGLADLDLDTLRGYRTEFAQRRPGHRWNSYSDEKFLECLGGWHIDRISGQGCLTLAGLLMFGEQHTIAQQVPHYGPDYQEQAPGVSRWLDRVTPDASWSGNLYDFYRRVYPKLVADLKVPFKLIEDRRVDETDVHKALREALVNTLVHSDYSGSVPIRIIKQPGRFSFRNPGLLRISSEEIYRGGTSDCRNRSVQKMFQLIGVADRAGTGFSTILQAWKEQSWLQPSLSDHATLEAVELDMRLISLIPAEAVQELNKRYGEAFQQLDAHERYVLVCAWHYESVTNSFLSKQMELHSADLTKLLVRLVKAGFLEQKLAGRWTSYRLGEGKPEIIYRDYKIPGLGQLPLFNQVYNIPHNVEDIPQIEKGIPQIEKDIPQTSSNIPQKAGSIPQLEYNILLDIARVAREGQPRQNVIDNIILKLCEGRYLTARQLAEIIGRSTTSIRDRYLTRLVASGYLELLYPEKPRSTKQAYRAMS